MNAETTIRWGILGTARIATTVAQAIQQAQGAEVAAVASRSPQRAAEWASQHGVPRPMSYDALLDDPDLDAIYIPLPPSMHADWTIRSARAGKHVLCEKALAMNAEEGEEMAAACAEHGVQLMDATMWVHHPRSVEMLQLIRDGKLGQLRRVNSAFSFVIEPYLRAKPPYQAAVAGELTIDRLVAHELRFQRELGGGSLLDLGWYNVRAALWAFGDQPQRVFATARYRHDVEMSVNATMWFGDDRVSAFDCGYERARRKWFEVVGTSGSLVCDDFLRPEKMERARYWWHDESGRSQERVSAVCLQEQRMIERFCRIVRSGELENHWPRISVANQRVCDAIARSARRGEMVELAT